MPKSFRIFKYVFWILPISVLLISFQNCGQVNLSKSAGLSSYSSTSIDLSMNPPTEFEWNRRYVFLLDMSYSMVSGPCPFDIDVTDSIHGFTNTYRDYDPNFPQDGVNFSDARARVADCSVDPSLGFGQMTLDFSSPTNSSYMPNHKTFKGNDFDGNRFKIFRTWLTQMRESQNMEFLNRTQILIIPAAGGLGYKRMMAFYPQQTAKFVPLSSPLLDQIIDYLELTHKRAADWALLPPATRFTQYDPNLELQKMGTTSFVGAYDSAFNLIDAEMQKLALAGNLTHSTFKLLSFTDNRINPLKAQTDKALSYMPTCVDCANQLDQAWGKAGDNELATVDLKLSLIQGLTKYYGSGFFETEFMRVETLPPNDPIQYYASGAGALRLGGEFPTGQKNVIDFLDKQSSDRKAASKVYKIGTAQVPYRMANNNSGVTTFKVTHAFILNGNFKVDENGKAMLDTDGDGLPDAKENLYGFDATKARTNGICLDSLMIEPGFKARCESLANSKLCNPQLDSDGDGLNECEEMTIGTDPFDFDTDGDGVPDSLEILYQMNPLTDDTKSDTNGDGLTNIMNLGKGLNPSVLPGQVLPDDLISITLDFTGQQKEYDNSLGDVKTDSFMLNLLNFPLAQPSMVASPLSASYLLRPGTPGFNVGSQIPAQHNLIQPVNALYTNHLIGLLRVIDPDEPLRVYWEMFTINMDTRVKSSKNTIDLSQFTQIKVIDRVRAAK